MSFVHSLEPLVNRQKDKEKMFSVFTYELNSIIYLFYINKFRNRCLQHTQKKLGQRHVYHWVTSPFLLITLYNHLGTEYINCCSFASGIVAHYWFIQDLSCSTVSPWSPLFHSPLHNAPYMFNRRQIWTAGRQVKHTHSMPTKPCCFNSCRMRPGIVLLKQTLSSCQKLPW